GGWGGDKGPSLRAELPQRQPDLSVTEPTGRDQALLYRLSGDRNPLHSDPAFARAAGFDRPILHGLCTFGVSTRVIVEAVADGDGARVRSIGGSFASPVFPGDPLTVDIWQLDEGHLAFRTRVEDTDVITGGSCELG
ncbi:MaoC family dehydratase, partial [Mycobacterium triplex]